MRRASAAATENELERAETVQAVRAALAGLAPEERAAVLLTQVEDLSQTDAAEVLGVPQRTVSDHARRGLEKLRASLSRAGYAGAALPALLGAALSVTVPASLRTAIHGLIAGKVAAATAAAKGGIAMKVVLGVVLAGALAGTIGLMGPIGPMGSPPSAAKGPPRQEHVALIHSAGGDLDGPGKEAIGGGFSGCIVGNVSDAEGNLWGSRWLRASDNQILRVSAYEYGTLGFDLKEGPVVGRPVTFVGGGYGWWCGGTALVGRPDAGGKTDGIYESLGREGQMIRVWKNKEKGGRWWFARAAGGGAAAAPRTKGQSADALAVKFGWLNEPQVGLDNKLRFMADNCFYLLEDGKVTCVLSPDDYKTATDVMKLMPNQGYVGGDGTFYIGYYYASGYDATKGAAIWRVTPDGKVEPWAQWNKAPMTSMDGDSLKESNWNCGPHLGQYSVGRFVPADAVFTSAHDEDVLRRIQNRRSSTLCDDGEWREFRKGDPEFDRFLKSGKHEASQRSGCYTATGAIPFQGGTIAPNGTVYHSYRRWIDMRLYRYTGLDFAKPTVNRPEGGK